VTGPANGSQPTKRPPAYTGARLYWRHMGKLPFLALGLAGLAACGNVQGYADASITVDGSDVDAPVDAVPFGPVTVDVRTMNGDGLPQIGATVVFVDSDGTETRAAADQDGKASAMVHPGATVTAIWLQASGPRLVTMLGVEPGDEVRLGQPGSTPSSETGRGSITVPETGTPSQKYAFTACGGNAFEGTGPLTLTWNNYCDQADTDILVVAADAQGNYSQYVYVGNVPNTQRAAVAVPGPWRFSETFDIAYTAPPAGTRYINVERHVRSGARDLYSTYGGGEVSGGTASFALPYSPMVGDDMEVETTLVATSTDEVYYADSKIRHRLAPNPTLQVRLPDVALPYVAQSKLDLTARTVSWPQTAGGLLPDAVISDSYFYRDPGDASPQVMTWWRVIAPGGTTTLTLPTLPADLEELLPRPTDITYNGTVMLVASSDHDYRQVRALIDIDYSNWIYGSGPADADVFSVSGIQER
jgi:hypothetical protein